MEGRLLRFLLAIPKESAQEERRRWRALHLAIKAKLEIAKEEIETFDEVFLANIVTYDGQTVGEQLVPQLKAVLSGQSAIKLLSDGVM
jgi:hypothetical protein